MKEASEFIRAASHPLRVAMIEIIKTSPSISVTEIYIRLRIEQSVASQHLRILRDAGIVTSMKQGVARLYRIHPSFFIKRSYLNSFKKNTQ